MKLINWNILSGGGKRLASIVNTIERHTPDIVVLTEFRHGKNGVELSTHLNKLGLHHQKSTVDSGKPMNGVLLASSIELDMFDGPDVPEELQQHALACRIIDLNIIATFCNKPKPTFDVLATYVINEPHGNTLLTGDLYWGELGSNPRAYRNKLGPLFKAGWVDCYRRDHPDEIIFSHRNNGGGRSRPDHVFATDDTESRVTLCTYDTAPLDRGISDHALMACFIEE